MSKPSAIKSRKPNLMIEADEPKEAQQQVDTFEEFCKHLKVINESAEAQLYQATFSAISLSDSNVVIGSPDPPSPAAPESGSVHLIQFEEFNPEKRSNTKSGSESIKSHEVSRQQIKDISYSRFGSLASPVSDKYLHEPPGPSNRTTLIRFNFPTQSYRLVKKHLQIVIPEIEATQSSYEQTLIKRNDTNTEQLRINGLQEEILQMKARHAKQIRKMNEQLSEQRKEVEMVGELKFQLESLANANSNLQATNSQLMEQVARLQKPLDVSHETSDKIQFLVAKINKKNDENAQLQYQISRLHNQIEQFQNHYYLENRKELSIEPFEMETSLQPHKHNSSEQVSLAAHMSKSDVPHQKHLTSYSHVFKEDITKQSRVIGSSEMLLNKIKQKKQSDSVFTLSDKYKSQTNLTEKQAKYFSIQTSPQTRKLVTEKPNSETSKVALKDQFKTNFFYLQRKGSDTFMSETTKQASKYPSKVQCQSIKELMGSSRKAHNNLSQLSKLVVSEGNKHLTTMPKGPFDRIQGFANIHQRHTSQTAQDTKPHFMTIFEF